MKKFLKVSILIILIFTFIIPITYAENKSINYANYVTKEMTKTEYWKDKAQSVNKVLMTLDEIKKLNQNIIEKSGTNVYDLETIETTKDADFDEFIINNEYRQLYSNGIAIDQEQYLDRLRALKAISKFPDGTERGTKLFYAVATKISDMKAWPTDEIIGYSETDPDDETQIVSINVNEPVVIRDVYNVDGDVFYYCQSKFCDGWVKAENLALFDNKEDWVDAWKFDESNTDFLVVTQDKITLEESITAKSTSEVVLGLGTVLKLVPENEIPLNIEERGTWNNYVVYLPTRDNNGKYVKQPALISEHHKVNIGYLPMTQGNILDVAFSCLGNRLGWGGMLKSMDGSQYVRTIYKCFGLELPRNTTWQVNTPGKITDISSLTDSEKYEYIKKLPVGSLLYFKGLSHVEMYVGTENGKNYVINGVGSLMDSTGDLGVQSMYSIVLNPLTVRRRNGDTWLSEIGYVLSLVPEDFIKEEKKPIKVKDDVNVIYPVKNLIMSKSTYEYNGKTQKPSITIKDAEGNKLKKGKDYYLKYSNYNSKKVGKYKIKVVFKGNYNGTKTLTYKIKPNKTKITNLTSAHKRITVKWNKKKAQVTGYQIQYSTKQNFLSSNKKITIVNNKKTYKKITKLKANKKYYVRIRTFKAVGGTKLYSSWSKAKNVITK